MLRNALFAALASLALASPALAVTTEAEPREVEFSFEGPLGRFEQAQLQRGYKVYREVCAACHSMNLLSFRNLGQKGGPFFEEKYPNPNDSPYVKAIAKDYNVADIDSETGDAIQRPATSADRFPAPFPNEAAARASNGGALPPDLSLIAKARHHGPHYIYSILTGYKTPPHGLQVGPGQYYNPYMPGDLGAFWKGDPKKVPVGGFIAMPPPLLADKVAFDDGTKSTVEQQAKDVSAFLAWASEPVQEQRKAFGFGAMIYLLLFAILMWFSYRRVWRNVAH